MYRSIFLGSLCFFFAPQLIAQATCSGSIDDSTAQIETFGFGPNFGPELPSGATAYTYGSLGAGNYVVTNSTGLNGNLWHSDPDFTPGDFNGYMLLFDGDVNTENVLSWTFDNLCPNSRYEFSLEAANVVRPNACGGNSVLPNILLNAFDAKTGMILEFGSFMLPVTDTLSWRQLQFSFDLPSNTTSVEVRVMNTAGGGCGNDFAIDELRMLRCNYRITQDLDLCDFGGAYSIGNSTYTTAGTYFDTLYSASTCNDTVYTTNLTIGDPLTFALDTLYYCPEVGIEVGGVTYFSDSIVIDTIFPDPCLSIQEYQLLRLDEVVVQQASNLCPGESLQVGSSIYTSAGVYLDTLISSSGCDSLVATTLTQEAVGLQLYANGQLIANGNTGIPAEVQLILGDSLQLEVRSNGFGIPSYSWTASDQLSCPNCPLQTLRAIRSEQLSVSVSDPRQSCSQQLDFILEVLPCEPIYIPNAFSPNLDGVNDRFQIFPQDCVSNIEAFVVFDRWGGQVYGSTEARGWDGNTRGKAAVAGVYFYLVVLELANGEKLERSGAVQLLR